MGEPLSDKDREQLEKWARWTNPQSLLENAIGVFARAAPGSGDRRTMSAPDPREVLAERVQTAYAAAIREHGKDSKVVRHIAAIGDAASALSVDGGPPAWEGIASRIVWVKDAAKHDGYRANGEWLGINFTDDERDLLDDLCGVARSVSPVGEAERPWAANNERTSDTLAASSDGPAAPKAERRPLSEFGRSGYLTVNKRPVAAPATCDGEGRLWVQTDVDHMEQVGTCDGCPRCTPCGRCGTVGGGGTVYENLPGNRTFPRPCPDCGGTAPTGGERG